MLNSCAENKAIACRKRSRIRPLTKTGALQTTALVFLSSCTGPAPAPETAPPDIPGYRQLREEFGDLDFTPLRGRRIVLDPGHGGFFRGAVGPNGLSEAEVNRQMQAMTAGRDAVWLIGTEMEMWDQRHLLLQWLQSRAKQTLESGFARVTVWRFEVDS